MNDNAENINPVFTMEGYMKEKKADVENDLRLRDIEIAKLRYPHVEGVHICKNEKCNIFRVIPYYSANRNDAWELWDEMVNAGLLLTFQESNDIPDCLLYIGNKWYSGFDFADCVSQAWIFWAETLRSSELKTKRRLKY